MATYKVRGTAHNIIYPYRTEDGKLKQQWETYSTELEAMHRKAYIDYLQKNRLRYEILKAAKEYQCKRAVERAVIEQFRPKSPEIPLPHGAEDNTTKTYREFAEKWLPVHARKERFSPNSYDSYRSNLDRHILPYVGDWVMSTMTAEDIDDFLDALSQKPCRGPKSYGKRPEEFPTLSSSTVKKCYTILTSGFETALQWHYITSIPKVSAPSEKTVKRKAWNAQRVYEVLSSIPEDDLLHLAVHLTFVCSLRAGEAAGIDLHTAGQSPEVLMNHYNEALDYEKRALSRLVENSFYPQEEFRAENSDSGDITALMAQLEQNPGLRQALLQNLMRDANQRA